MFILLSILYFTLGGIDAAPATPLPTRSSLTPNFHDPPLCICIPDERSLTSIFWSCVSTIFVCSWIAVHPNIPRSDAPWWRPAWTRLELMAWTIVAPELMVFWAMRQWYGARKMQKIMEDVYPGWTNAHGYFVQMGGFMLYEHDGKTCKGVLYENTLRDHLQSKSIEVPCITEKDIQDRSKGDAFSKTVVVGQSAWFIAQCISRLVQNLETTKLELVTLAFAALNAFMYYFWWNKPLDVCTSVNVYLLPPPSLKETENQSKSEFDPSPITLDGSPTQEPPTMFPLTESETQRSSKIDFAYFIQWPARPMKAIYQRLHEMSAFSDNQTSDMIKKNDMEMHTFYATAVTDDWHTHTTQALARCTIGVLFGGIHCIGWNSSFFSTPEAFLWRSSSIVVTIIPVVMLVRYFISSSMGNSQSPGGSGVRMLRKFFWTFRVFIGLPAYMTSRIILLVIALVSLRNLPSPALAVVRWSTFLPHI